MGWKDMRIIISPAKKMRVDTESLPWRDLPRFLTEAQVLWGCLQGMTREELKTLWKCNDQILDLNIKRLQNMDLQASLTPALLAYEGIQYRYMAPGVFSGQALEYVQKHLRILSGFYGVLRPFDGVTPYRLEMQAKLQIGAHKDLYSYWGNTVAEKLLSETDCIINLASKEYSLLVSRYLTDSVRMITCIFGEESKGRIIEKGTVCKMARGEMVRYMAENQITRPEAIRTFNHLGYRFDADRSDETKFVFLRERTGNEYD